MIADGTELESSFYGEKSMILAKSGGGKSYTARVIIEDGLKKGVPFVIIDPQGAYANLPDFEYIDADKITNVKAFGQLIAVTNANIVINVKKLTPTKQNEFLHEFLLNYRRHAKKGIKTVVIDELHKFAPEGQGTASKDMVRGMCQEDRSDGTGFIGISQRAARIDKTILSQANHIFIGNLYSKADCQAVEGYLSDKSEIEKIKKLQVGEFYVLGFKEGEIIKIRKAETQHSGNAPQNLLNANKSLYNQYVGKLYKGTRQQIEKQQPKGDNMSATKVVNDLVPDVNTIKDLAGIGLKMSLGLAASNMVGAYASKIKSPIPFVSTRTLASGTTTVVLYAGHKNIPNAMAKDILKYAAAGSAVSFAGSALMDVLYAAKIKVPPFVSGLIAMGTGVSPVVVEGNNRVDTNTAMA